MSGDQVFRLPEQVFRLPDLGEGLTEAEIVTWLVKAGDTVTVDQVVVEVETAKAAVEVPVPYAGTVVALHAEAGSVLEVGRPLISIGGISTGDAAAEQYRTEERAGSGNVLIGYGTGHSPATRRRRSRSAAAAPAPGPMAAAAPAPIAAPAPAPVAAAAPNHTAATAPSHTAVVAASPGAAAPRVLSPLVRRLARTHGVDLATVVPDAAHGVIRRQDIERAARSAPIAGPAAAQAASPAAAQAASPAAAQAASPAAATAASPAAATAVDPAAAQAVDPAAAQAVDPAAAQAASPTAALADNPTAAQADRPAVSKASPVGERIPLRGVRRAVADKLTRSRTEIPEATTWVDVDATGLIEAKNALAGRQIGLLALIARICVAGLRRFPELNSTVDVEAAEIVRLPHVNLGFAAQTDRGLMVPVVHGADRMTTAELAAELSRLAGLARSGTLPPQAMTGGTFTLNNYGVFGVDGGNAIINHPEAGILGIGRIIDKPWVVAGELAVRKVTQLSLSFDHRVCDGGSAGGFLRYVADCVENPTTMLADL